MSDNYLKDTIESIVKRLRALEAREFGNVDGAISDHVAQSNPHTQYPLKSILTTRGDIIYRGASDWQRLAKGASGRVLTMGATYPAWAELPAGNEYVTIASDNVCYSNDTGRSVRATTDYVKIKEMKINAPLQQFNVVWGHRNLGAISTYSRIYINGVAVSPEYSVSGTSESIKTYTVESASANDLIQIYLRSNTVVRVDTAIRNMRICFSLVPYPLPTNQDPE